MTTSSTNHMPWCHDHPNNGDLCGSRTWEVAGMRLHLFGCEDDVPTTEVTVHVPTLGAAHTVEEASELSDALRLMAFLALARDRESATYWAGRLDALDEAS